jgi:hypothetical protein
MVLESFAFLNADVKFLEKLCDQEELIVFEINLYEALVRWSWEECRRRSLAVKVENQRQVLATLLPKVRFPLMPLNDFTEIVLPDRLLNDNQMVQVSNWLLAVDKPEINFITKFRDNYRAPEYSVSILTAIDSPSSSFEMVVNESIRLIGYARQINELEDPGAEWNNLKERGPDGFHRYNFKTVRPLEGNMHHWITLPKFGEYTYNKTDFKHSFKNTLNMQTRLNCKEGSQSTIQQKQYLDIEQRVFFKEIKKYVKFNFLYCVSETDAQLQMTKLYFTLKYPEMHSY